MVSSNLSAWHCLSYFLNSATSSVNLTTYASRSATLSESISASSYNCSNSILNLSISVSFSLTESYSSSNSSSRSDFSYTKRSICKLRCLISDLRLANSSESKPRTTSADSYLFRSTSVSFSSNSVYNEAIL